MQQNYWKWPYFSAVDKLIMYGNGYFLNLKTMLFIFKSLFSKIQTKAMFFSSPRLALLSKCRFYQCYSLKVIILENNKQTYFQPIKLEHSGDLYFPSAK